MKTVHRLPAVLLPMALTVLTGPRTSAAAEQLQLRVGFDGSYKVGFWTPIEVDFGIGAADAATCNVRVADADGNETIAPLTQISEGRFAGVFRSGRLNAAIRVQSGSRIHAFAPLEDGADDSGESAIRPARQSVLFLGVVGSGELIEQAVALLNGTADGAEDGEDRARVIRFPDWSALPASGPGWEALDVLFVSDDLPETDQQSEALRNWVRRGGHLVLSIGDRSDAFQSSPLSGWVPAPIDGTRPVNELATIADRVPRAQPLPVRPGIVAARMNPEQGEVLLSTFEGPLVARFAYGIGRVTLFALDYRAAPLSAWDGTPQFCLFLADVDLNDVTTPDTQSRMSGVSGLATQLAASLDWFPAVSSPSYRSVLVAVLCFLLVVGPVDYFFVHRLLKRPRRTWFTFPAAVLVVAGCGVVVARRAHPEQVLVNQLEVVDIDASLATARVRNWAAVYSPAPRRYPVEFTTEPWMAGNADGAARVSWFGKPETGFRGMYRAGGVDIGNADYEFAPGYASIRNLPVDQWSTKSLSAEWEQQLEAAPVENNLVDDGSGELAGSLTHDLPAPITDWMLAYGGYVYFADEDSPDSEVRIAPGIPLEPAKVRPVPRILKFVLVGGHNIVIDRGDKVGGDTTTPGRRAWDPLDRDPWNLMRMVTFHAAAGGREYTGLSNATLARSDLSHLLPLRRAVLLGRITGPAMRCSVGEEADIVESSSFVRIILPVEPAASDDGD